MTQEVDKVSAAIEQLESIRAKLEEYDEYSIQIDNQMKPIARHTHALGIAVDSQVAMIKETL